jgi:hypothetical protein
MRLGGVLAVSFYFDGERLKGKPTKNAHPHGQAKPNSKFLA